MILNSSQFNPESSNQWYWETWHENAYSSWNQQNIKKLNDSSRQTHGPFTTNHSYTRSEQIHFHDNMTINTFFEFKIWEINLMNILLLSGIENFEGHVGY